MKKRWIVGGVLVVLLGISATGIAVNSAWLSGRWDASHAATDLAAQLHKLDGVTTATTTYDPLGLPNPTVVSDVVFASDASPAQWGAATALVRSAASTRALAGTTSTAVFSQAKSTTSVTVEPTYFTAAAVTAEIAAWHELRQAVGDRVSLRLGHESGWTQPPGPIVREYDVQSQADARTVAELWPDTAPTVDPAVPTIWKGPGLQQWAGMPSKALMTTLSAVGAILPLASADKDPKQTGTFAVILASRNGYKVTLLSLRDGELITAEPNKGMARAAQAAFATGANSVEWENNAGGIRSLVSGDCGSFTTATQTIQTTLHRADRDDAFAAKLVGFGFVQPTEVRAGACY
ncbi:MAG: hypothetical protein ABIP33_00290 [Pseudolysinimonas sp.]